jgi:uncharacterized protein
MPAIVCAAVSGILFGLSLIVSHMIDPAKVLALLDIAGDWDPSLACVMLGALGVTLPSFAPAKRRAAPLCATEFVAPTARRVDKSLMCGALLFGIARGLMGYWPGPALASIGFGNTRTLLFVAAMLTGMAMFSATRRRRMSSCATRPRTR